MILYFTGTGNSRKCAGWLGAKLGEKWVDIVPTMKKGEYGAFQSETPWVFVCPTYGWQAPRVFVDFLRRSRFEGSRQAYFVLTCGGEIGNAGESLRTLCQEKGWEYKGAAGVVMPDNYLVLFSPPSQEEGDKMLERAKSQTDKLAALIRKGEGLPEKRSTFFDRLKSGAINQGMYRFFIKDKAFRTHGCVSCGLCQRLCPMGNIRMVEGKPQWQGNCIHCMACIAHCPAEAIEYGRRTQGKTRWHC